MLDRAVVLTDDCYDSLKGKVAHGLVRGTSRFDVVAVVDATLAGRDAGEVLEGKSAGIPIVAGVAESLSLVNTPQVAVVGCAPHGGRLTNQLRAMLLEAASNGLSIVSGLHDYVSDIEEIVELTRKHGATITDVRKAPRPTDMHFWNGDIYTVSALRIAVLGTDCAIGKRTTTRWLTESLQKSGTSTEMIYTGQTGWMQGGRYGIIHDSLPGDFVSGELEHEMVRCDREIAPDVMLIEGQSSLRNPAGPCGTTLMLSAAAHGAIVQHAPARTNYDGQPGPAGKIPSLASEIALIEAHGVPVLAVTLNLDGFQKSEYARVINETERAVDVPVFCPAIEGTDLLAVTVLETCSASAAA